RTELNSNPKTDLQLVGGDADDVGEQLIALTQRDDRRCVWRREFRGDRPVHQRPAVDLAEAGARHPLQSKRQAGAAVFGWREGGLATFGAALAAQLMPRAAFPEGRADRTLRVRHATGLRLQNVF